MKARIERSLRLLRRDTIDVLTMDPVNTASCLNKVTSPTGCMKAVEEAQAQGLVKHLGISTHGPMEFVLKALDTELFEGVRIHYSYCNQRNQAVLDKATEMKIGVAVVSPVDRGGSLSHPSAILEECCEPLHPIVVNHRFILQHAAVTTVCIDAARARDFDVHEPVFENDEPLSDLETLSLELSSPTEDQISARAPEKSRAS